MATWTIANLEYNNDADKGVVVAHWRVTEEDGDYTASSYDSLTEETVIGWVKDSLDAAEIEAGLTANIEAQKAPATLAGMPWATEEVA
jgi:hypothetical protein